MSLPAACGADTGSPAQSRRTAAGGSSSIPGISLSRNQRCASGYEMDVLPSLALAPSLDSSPSVTRPQSSCTALGGWSYLAPGEPPAGSLLPVPDTLRRPTPCAPRRAVSPATYACRPPKPPTYTLNAHGLAWSPPRCAPSDRSGESTAGPPPQPLSDPYVTLSRHTAPVIQPRSQPQSSGKTTAVQHSLSCAATACWRIAVPIGLCICVWPIVRAHGQCADKQRAWPLDRMPRSSSTTPGLLGCIA